MYKYILIYAYHEKNCQIELTSHKNKFHFSKLHDEFIFNKILNLKY